MKIRAIVICCFLLVYSATMSQISSAMQRLLEQDDLKAIRKISISDEELLPLLQESIQAGAAEIAHHLIKKMPEPNALSEAGMPTLHLTVLQEQEGLTKLLLERGADPNLRATDKLGTSALMMATARRNANIIRMLIDHGADINAIDLQGDPVVNWAAYYGNDLALEQLVAKGVNLGVRSKHGNAADVFLRLWYPDQLLQVFDGTILAKDISKDTEKLHAAISNENLSELKKLLHKGIKPNSPDAYGSYPIHRIAARGNLAMMELLLAQQTEINVLNRAGQTALTQAARFGHLEVVKLLLSKDAQVNAADEKYGLSALIGSAVGGHVAISKLLVAAGANIDHQDVINESAAIHWALYRSHPDVADYLLDLGADYRMKILDGSSDFLALAKSYEHQELVQKISVYQQQLMAIIGSYTTANIQYIYTDTTYVVDKPAPGIFVAAPERYVILYHPSSRIRAAFKDFTDPSCEDLKQAYQNLIFNTGSYHVTDHLLVAHPDIARVPGFEGAKQTYEYEITEDQLTLTMFDETYPNGEKPAWYGKLRIQLTFTRE